MELFAFIREQILSVKHECYNKYDVLIPLKGSEYLHIIENIRLKVFEFEEIKQGKREKKRNC